MRGRAPKGHGIREGNALENKDFLNFIILKYHNNFSKWSRELSNAKHLLSCSDAGLVYSPFDDKGHSHRLTALSAPSVESARLQYGIYSTT